VAWPVIPFYRRSCAWRRAAAGDEAVFEFEEGEGTHILPAVGMIRDNGEELPALSASRCRMNCTCALNPPIYTGIAIELTLPTLKVDKPS
jgi:hypothetical protein